MIYVNNTWIGTRNISGEWSLAYHGVGDGQNSDNVKRITGLIIKSEEFKAGVRQKHKNHPDKYHPEKIVGEGVYITPHIETAENFSGISNINGKIIKQ